MGRFVSLLVVLGLFVIQAPEAKAEYVIFKVTKNPLTRKSTVSPLNSSEFQKAYEIVTQYKWPTNVYTFYANPNAYPIDYFQPLAEETYIRSQIKGLNPSFDIAFIPTSIYELAFLGRDVKGDAQGNAEMIEGAQDIHPELMGEPQYKSKLIEDKAIEIVSAPNLSDEQAYLNVLKFMYDRNVQPKAIEIAHKMNTEIIGVIQKDLAFIKTLKAPSQGETASTGAQTQADTQDTTAAPKKKRFGGFKGLGKKLKSIVPLKKAEDRLRNYISSAITKYFSLYGDEKASWNKLVNPNLVLKPIFRKAMEMELEARQTNEVYIFRGSEGKDSPLRMNKETHKKFSSPAENTREQMLLGKTNELPGGSTHPYSISYGYSLMAGMAIESGGNVYRFMVAYNGGYGLKLSLKDFFDKSRPYMRDMFFTPPFGTVFSFYATDDLFHPRTKVGLGQGVQNGQAIIEQLQLGAEKGKRLSWVVGVAKSKQWKDSAADLANYISAHSSLIYSADIRDSIMKDRTNYVIPANIPVSGGKILSSYHTDLLHFKEHSKKMTPVLQELKKETPEAAPTSVSKDPVVKRQLPPRMRPPIRPRGKFGQRNLEQGKLPKGGPLVKRPLPQRFEGRKLPPRPPVKRKLPPTPQIKR